MIEAAVADASVAVKWVIGEAGEDAAAWLATRRLSAPDILLADCASALWAKVRRREIDEDEAIAALVALGDAPVVMTAVPALVADALRLALLLAHSICDCLYLALSLQTRTPLVTADRRFAATDMPGLLLMCCGWTMPSDRDGLGPVARGSVPRPGPIATGPGVAGRVGAAMLAKVSKMWLTEPAMARSSARRSRVAAGGGPDRGGSR
jgi:predicted nucleic acid-binding protein